MRRLPQLLIALALTSVVGAVVVLAAAGPAAASSRQMAMFEDDNGLYSDPVSTLAELRLLGVSVVRVSVHWSAVLSPQAAVAAARPAGFSAADPASPKYDFTRVDRIVQDAVADGIKVDLSITGKAPEWATGPRKPGPGSYPQWEPSAAAYGGFVTALGRRYSGQYRPNGAAALPRVSIWELWNEPNFGMELAPQAIDGSTVPVAAVLYRRLVDAGWQGLLSSHHGHDTVIVGNLDARGQSGRPHRGAPQGYPGNFAATKPLAFVRELYCVGSDLRPLRGRAARVIGCPTTSGGSVAFSRRHPALFRAAGFGVHPYPLTAPPDRADTRDLDFAEFHQLGHFIRELDKIQRSYRSRHRFAIYNDEFGYITDPPNSSQRFPSPTQAAAYLNWAEYLSWLNPRIASTMQYLMTDPNPVYAPEYGGFATGLRFYDGAPKPSYDAYRLPVFIPTTARHGRVLVWGCARPASSYGNRHVSIEFRSRSGRFTTLATVSVTNPRGYFERWVTVHRSGLLRLSWSYPSAATIHSRTVHISPR